MQNLSILRLWLRSSSSSAAAAQLWQHHHRRCQFHPRLQQHSNTTGINGIIVTTINSTITSAMTIIINTIISRCSSLPSPPSLFPVAINEPSCRCPDRKSAFRGPFVFGRTSWQVPVMSRRQQFQVWGLRIFVLRASSSLGTADIFTAMEPLIRVQEVAAGGTCFSLTWE